MEFVLAVPLMRMAPRAPHREWRCETNSGSIHTERSATAAADIEGEIRFAKLPLVLLEGLWSRRGRSITYVEDLGSGNIEFPGTLIGVDPSESDAVGLEPDPQRYSHGEYSARIRFRLDDPSQAAVLYGFRGT